MGKTKKARKKAERAIHNRIEKLAADADPAQVKDLAEAHQKITFGSGGNTLYDYHHHPYREQSSGVGFTRGEA